MKVLSFGIGYFELPEDFEGSFSDALRILADYHDEVKHSKKRRVNFEPPYSKYDTTNVASLKTWDEFLNSQKMGYKYFGSVSISKLDKSNRWTYIDENLNK